MLIIKSYTPKIIIAITHLIWLVSLGNKAICIMPPVLVPQFHASFSSNYPGIEQQVKIELFAGDVKTRNEMIETWNRSGWPDILVMSNDMFAGKSAKEIKNLQAKRGTAKLSPADEAGPDLWLQKGYNHLVVDEATSVKSPSSGLHKAVKTFVGTEEESNGLVLMTGSPVETNVTDAYGLIALITPKRYGSYRAFERWHCIIDYSSRFPMVLGYQRLEHLYESLYLKGRRVTKKDCLDLPARMVSETQVELARPHKQLYDRLVKERILEIGDRVIDATEAVSLYIKTQQVILCPEHFYDGEWKTENTLLTALDELIHSLGGRKLLIFAWYTATIEKLVKRYAKLNPVTLYGPNTATEREVNKAKFIDDPKCRLMVANPRSAGIGVDGLQTVCSHVAFIETPTSPGLFDQALSRLHRSGQKGEAVNVYVFTALNTIAVKLRNSLVKKEAEANAVVRDAKVLLRDLSGAEGLSGLLDDATPPQSNSRRRYDVSSNHRLMKRHALGGGQ